MILLNSAGEQSSSDTNLSKCTATVYILSGSTVLLFNIEELLNVDSEFLTGVACHPLLNFDTNLHTKSGVACYPRPNPIEARVAG